jgi:predicted alpha/beta-fold hydrolase
MNAPGFEPHTLLRNGHAMTIAAAYWPRKFVLPPPEARLFRVAEDSQLLAACHWQAGMPKDAPVIAIVHGLEGSCDSNYVLGIAEKAYQRGFHVVRLNQRNCGGTETLTPTLYNSGMSGDYRAVFEELAHNGGFTQIFFAGYSMGGNLALQKPENYFYQRRFVNGLMNRYARKAALFPEIYSRNGFAKIRSVRGFDDAITAPCFGYRDAQEYYESAGARKVVARVRVPMLMITAQDDPFVPYESFLAAMVAKNPAIQFLAPERGGHCGFISKHSGAERFWAEARVVEFCEELRR